MTREETALLQTAHDALRRAQDRLRCAKHYGHAQMIAELTGELNQAFALYQNACAALPS